MAFQPFIENVELVEIMRAVVCFLLLRFLESHELLYVFGGRVKQAHFHESPCVEQFVGVKHGELVERVAQHFGVLVDFGPLDGFSGNEVSGLSFMVTSEKYDSCAWIKGTNG